MNGFLQQFQFPVPSLDRLFRLFSISNESEILTGKMGLAVGASLHKKGVIGHA
ncbi:MAG: hypothetical protein ACYDAM_11345 [Leptospirales bacterium]